MDYLGRRNYAKALASVKASGEWPENLGVGKPYDELIDTRLRRLAVRLRLSWTYMVGNYRLHQLILHSIPLRYQVVPVPDVATGNTYPSLLSLFTTLVENDINQEGTYCCWLPANVRGEGTAATSQEYRTKQTAPLGSSYAAFIAVNTSDAQKKLDYRLYLGGEEGTDFNLYENTVYTYSVRFAHAGLPVNDRRVTTGGRLPMRATPTTPRKTVVSFCISKRKAAGIQPTIPGFERRVFVFSPSFKRTKKHFKCLFPYLFLFNLKGVLIIPVFFLGEWRPAFFRPSDNHA